MTDWQDISTAPKDRPVLACVEDRRQNTCYWPDKVWWSDRHGVWVIALTDAGKPIVATVPYTHWSDLPLPPVALTAAERAG